MKAIMISVKPKWCAKIMNGEKTIEVRSSKSLASAIQKLVNENGYADIYVYCSKDNKKHLYPVALLDKHNKVFKRGYKEDDIDNRTNYLNGKVVFKFRCYKMEKIGNAVKEHLKSSTDSECWVHKTCLSTNELKTYLNKNVGYAIHISDLEIFDRPKELREFSSFRKPYWNKKTKEFIKEQQKMFNCRIFKVSRLKPLTKAPQNFCYVEVE